MRILVLLLVLLPALHAELQLWLTGLAVNEVTNPVTPQAVGATVSFPEVRENDLVDATFQIRNPGGPVTSIVNLTVVPKANACGAGGAATNPAFILMLSPTNPPGNVNAGGAYTFQVRYLPPKPQCYEAYLVFANLTFTLRGTASGRTVMQETDTLGTRQLINGGSSDFGNVRVGEGYTKSYRITNPGTQSVTIAPPVLSGEAGAWLLVQAPESNRTVPPNGVYEFKTEFRPGRTGLITATLTVDGRAINLVGRGLAAQVPDFTLSAPTDVDSATQAEARIELASAAAQELTGTLTLVFEKDIGDFPDDAAIVFVASGSRTIPFRVPAGATKAQFGSGTSEIAQFQTGTASGKIRLIATLGPWEHSTQINIRSDAPKLLSGTLAKASGTVTVAVSGYDNTRSVSTIQFRFFDANDQPLGIAAGYEVPVSEIFGTFFRASTLGGQFAVKATFPVQGDLNAIARVDVQLRNKLGPSLTFAAR